MFTPGHLSYAGPRTFNFRTAFVERKKGAEEIGANVFPVCLPGIRGFQKTTFDVS